jgi:glycosyltransferase involved in cell wall biosynthesis
LTADFDQIAPNLIDSFELEPDSAKKKVSAFPHPPLTVVICVDHAATTGGQAKVAADSAIGLKRQGHRPILFAAAGPIAPELKAAGVEVICLGQDDLHGNASRMAAAIQGTWNFEAGAALGKLLASLPRATTIVHVHGWAKALSAAIAPPIGASGLPALYTFHEYSLFCPSGGFYNYPKSAICHLEPLSAACWLSQCNPWSYGRKLWKNTRLLVAQKGARLPEAFSDFITISDFQREIVTPLLPRGAHLHRLSNPVSVADLGPKSDPLSGDIIFIGRISLEKGPLLFAEAARRIGMIPTFIGDGPSLPDLVAQYPEARILGWQFGDQVRDLMRAARGLVFPSLWYEGQPLTVLEAKALGVPVIVADTCAGRDEVEDGVTGLWFKGGDAGDLARALVALGDDAKVAAMSAAAYRAYWADARTIEHHTEGLVSIYRGMLDEHRAKVTEKPVLRTSIDSIRAAARHEGV